MVLIQNNNLIKGEENNTLQDLDFLDLFSLLQQLTDKVTLALDSSFKFNQGQLKFNAMSKEDHTIENHQKSNDFFVNLDLFQKKCQDMMHFARTIKKFIKVQKIEIGNTKEKANFCLSDVDFL